MNLRILLGFLFLLLVISANAQFTGGNSDGYYSLQANTQKLGTSIYNGGNGKGDYSMQVSSQKLGASLYNGGSGKGDYSIQVSSQKLGASIYNGGSGKGDYSLLAATQKLGTSIYGGGNGKGDYSSQASAQKLGANIYVGGVGKGDTKSNATSQMLGVSIYNGGVGKGDNSIQINGISIEALPITLISFSGKQMDEHVMLTWSTASELNNWYFEILRSSDGEHFETIGSVTGAGTSSAPRHYSLLDTKARFYSKEKTIFYYKLKQVDIDGRFSYSAVIALEIKGTLTISIFPNPVSEQLHIQIQGANCSDYLISILDNQGSVVKSMKLDESYILDVNELSPGVYFLRIHCGNQILETVKIIVQK